jgi:hypothetical protein
MKFLTACCVLMLLLISSMVSAQTAAQRFVKNVTLGDTVIQLEVIRYGLGPVFVALHENESTAVTAAKKVVPVVGGTLIILRHGGNRNVTFTLSGVTYQFDPNRIFTKEGIRQTLKGGSAKKATEAVQNLAKVILAEIGTRPIVALHNNTNSAYSIVSYLPRGQYSRDAKEVHRVLSQDADDFFFTTSKSLFTLAKQNGFNVALQADAPNDDGSLSVYSGKRGLLYVNVEAEQGNTGGQFNMLIWLMQNWP